MTILDAALEYLNSGWLSVPLGYKEKRILDKGWTSWRLNTPEKIQAHFNCKPMNIGVLTGEPSGGLIDVDIDVPEALPLADAFLPATRTFGRKSNPASHRLFVVDGPSSLIPFQFEKDKLVEYRGTGGQTVFPPSVHPEGEEIQWESNGKPLEIDGAKLLEKVGIVAAGALLARSWPKQKGSRDDIAMALAGGLSRADWPVEKVEKFIFAVSTAAQDEESRARAAKARHTAEKLKNGVAVTGWPRLAELLDNKDVVTKVREWLGIKQESIDADRYEDDIPGFDESDNGTRQKETQKPQPKGFSPDLVIPALELVSLDIPEREEIIEDLFYTRSTGMIFSPRGLGKTYLGLSLVDAVASGKNFLSWNVPLQRRCLFVDGELSASELQARVRAICGKQPSPLLEFISSEFFYATEKRPLTLNDPIHQGRFIVLLDELKKEDRLPEVIVFDNLSSMTYGSDEDKNSDQDSILRFMLELRHRGFSTIFKHHTGKSGDQRGASRREDFLDFSIKLSEPLTPNLNRNAEFILEFSKIRRRMPTPSKLDCELIEQPDGTLTWITKALDQDIEKWIVVLRFIQNMKPDSQSKIADGLSITAGTVSKHVKKLRDKAYLEPEILRITRKGIAFLNSVYGDENDH